MQQIRDFNQAYVAPSIFNFEEGFRKKWNIPPYTNPNRPAIFFGCYNTYELKVILNHKAPFIMIWGGSDQSINSFKAIQSHPYLVGSPAYREPMVNTFESMGYPYKNIILPLKDYSSFKPTPLGNKIYLYRGWKVPRSSYFQWDQIVEPLIERYGKQNFIYGLGKNLDYVHEHFYKQSFVYLKPNPKGGSTSMWELGHMGRKTIAQEQGSSPNVLNYTDLDSIIELIEHEKSKIGTIQSTLSEKVHNTMMHTDEWLTLNFWK